MYHCDMMKDLEKPDIKKLFSGEQNIILMSNALLSNWDEYSKDITDEKLKSSIGKKVLLLKRQLQSTVDGVPHEDLKLLQTYGEVYMFLEDVQKNSGYDAASIISDTSEKISLFIKYKDDFTDEEYWKNLASDYIMQDYKKIPYSTYYKLFLSTRDKRELLMNEQELDFFKALPEKFTIYRGGTESEANTRMYGISWTLNKAIAEKFQNVKKMRDRKPMVIHELEIEKSEAIAYLNERQEEEIIYIHPKHYNKYRD